MSHGPDQRFQTLLDQQPAGGRFAGQQRDVCRAPEASVEPDINRPHHIPTQSVDEQLYDPALPLPVAHDGHMGDEARYLALAHAHATGEAMPRGELQLQGLLNADVAPTYSLRDVEELDSYIAQAIIFLEMRISFPNALGHIREARELFPEDPVLGQGDFQVLRTLKDHPPEPPKLEDQKDNRGFFEKLFSIKKKEEKKECTKSKARSPSKEESVEAAPEDGAGDDHLDPTAPHPDTKHEKPKKEKKSLFSVFTPSSHPKRKDSSGLDDEVLNEQASEKKRESQSSLGEDALPIPEPEGAASAPKAEKTKKEKKFSFLGALGSSTNLPKDAGSADALDARRASEHSLDEGDGGEPGDHAEAGNTTPKSEKRKKEFTLFGLFSSKKEGDGATAAERKEKKKAKGDKTKSKSKSKKVAKGQMNSDPTDAGPDADPDHHGEGPAQPEGPADPDPAEGHQAGP